MSHATDGGRGPDTNHDVDEALAGVAREAIKNELEGAYADVEDGFHSLAYDTLSRGGDPTPEQVNDLRRAMNEMRYVLEEHVAPVAGVEPWGDATPRIPMGVLRELSHHPKAEEGDDDGGETDE